MNQNETDAEESVDAKRANYERFAMTVCENGYVNVCNKSHNDDKNHTYSVAVSDGEVVGCSCPHHVHRGAHCKHMRSVINSPITLFAASAASATGVATDGGERQ